MNVETNLTDTDWTYRKETAIHLDDLTPGEMNAGLMQNFLLARLIISSRDSQNLSKDRLSKDRLKLYLLHPLLQKCDVEIDDCLVCNTGIGSVIHKYILHFSYP